MSKVVSSKTNQALLSGIQIVAKEDSLILIGSNSDMMIEQTIPAVWDGKRIGEVRDIGSTVVSARYLHEIIKKLPNDDIHFTIRENQSLIIQSGDIRTKLTVLFDEMYPSLPAFNQNARLRILSL